MFERILDNLIENAVKYSSAPGKIIIEVAVLDTSVYLRVVDEGVGIPEHEHKIVFEKFQRLGNEDTRSSKGTGLGLFIVREVVESHKGIIKIYSNEPKGSIFEVILKKAQ